MNDNHIVSSFDRELEQIQAHIMKMGGLVEEAILDASKSLKNRDEELAEQVRNADKAIDALEELINDECIKLIALRSPAAVDLRVALSVMKISGNLERIGDYAKNMAKRTSVLVHMTPVEGARGALRRMAREVQLMLKDALDAYIQRDVELAHDILARDHDIDQMYNALFREFLTFMMEDPRYITPCMHLHFIAKNTERMGDHVTSIAEQVIYLVTGSMPDDIRPKDDHYKPELHIAD
ncbi:phosphate signaling complex protein PhoU [Shimia litoralis]|uniref:Phosphate-specific transport system accessory protein PhoU n=1 Tax=Shimia litoralis TaxID=420403 RepID=A0A4U7N948_9RHOB|nr:phosphate signaling complex protein PhoU [Shimia litoralis]TKZ21144.1 phosphate signaling complex protein PhoU [Shimia litoralis]